MPSFYCSEVLARGLFYRLVICYGDCLINLLIIVFIIMLFMERYKLFEAPMTSKSELESKIIKLFVYWNFDADL